MVARPGTTGSNETVWKRRRQPSRVEDAALGRGGTRPGLRIAAAIPSRGRNLCSRDNSPPRVGSRHEGQTAVLLVRCGFDGLVRLSGWRPQGRAVCADLNTQIRAIRTATAGPTNQGIQIRQRCTSAAGRRPTLPPSAARRASLPRRTARENSVSGPRHPNRTQATRSLGP